MPMFSFISGCLFLHKLEKLSFAELLKDKMKRVLIPYIVFSLCWMIPIRLLINFSQYQGEDFLTIVGKGIFLGENNGHLWYLVFIFMAFVITYLLYRLLGKTGLDAKWIVLILFMISFTCYALQHKSFFLFKPRVMEKFNANYVWFCFGLFYRVWIKPLDEGRKLIRYGRWLALAASVGLFVLYITGKFTNAFPVGLVSIVAVYLFMPNRQMKAVSILSRDSFGIYLFHSPFVYITFTYWPDISPLLVLLINFVGFGAVAWLLTNLTRKIGLKSVIGE